MRSDEITRHDPDTIRFDDTIALGIFLGVFSFGAVSWSGDRTHLNWAEAR